MLLLGLIVLLLLVWLGLLLKACLYRPPENHLAVVYWIGRFGRWVDSDQWTLIIPLLERIQVTIDLCPRSAAYQLADVLTHDRCPVDLDLVVTFRVDPRRATVALQVQMSQSAPADCQQIVKLHLREVATDLVGDLPLDRLLDTRARLRRDLSTRLAHAVRPMGIYVDVHQGVSVQDIRPTAAVRQAMINRLIALPTGEAAADRIRPLIEALRQDGLGVGGNALFLEYAAIMAETGQLPVGLSPILDLFRMPPLPTSRLTSPRHQAVEMDEDDEEVRPAA